MSAVTRIIAEDLYRSQNLRPICNPLGNSSYITGVLGIQIPLNESFPYSSLLVEQILHEQLLFEGFWGDLLQKGKDKLLDKVEGIKKFGKEAWAILSAFYHVIKGGASEIGSFTGAVAKKGINIILKKINATLKWMVEKLPGWNMPTFTKLAQKALDVIASLTAGVNSLKGWKRVIGFAGLAVGLAWLWDKVGGWIDEFKGMVGDWGNELSDEVTGPLKEWIKETAMEKLKEVGGNAFQKIMTTLASVTSGVKPWWDAAVKVAGGAKLVIDALGSGAARFMSRRKRKPISTTPLRSESLVRDYVQSILREAYYSSRGIRV